jgi:hypothetical protein
MEDSANGHEVDEFDEMESRELDIMRRVICQAGVDYE